jgi:hypothetical protein
MVRMAYIYICGGGCEELMYVCMIVCMYVRMYVCIVTFLRV